MTMICHKNITSVKIIAWVYPNDISYTLCIKLCLLFYLGHWSGNQRTSGPVNAHLTPGPGIYLIHIFNDFIHVYSPGARAENPLGTNFWCQQKALTTSTICCNFQTNLFQFWFYTHFLMFFHVYIAPGQGQTTLCGQNLDANRKALSLPICCKFQKNIFEVWFYT